MVQRGEFSAIIASLAVPQFRIFSGIYILITAFLGVFLFQRAPALANWYHSRVSGKDKIKGKIKSATLKTPQA